MDQALACYKEALTHDEGSSDAMLALADVYIKKVWVTYHASAVLPALDRLPALPSPSHNLLTPPSIRRLAHLDPRFFQGDYEGAQYQLSTLLHQNTTSDTAAKTKAATRMADIMYRKHEYDSATYHLQQVRLC